MSESKHKDELEVKKPAKVPDRPVDFANLFQTASDPAMPWPPAVLTWAAKSSANQSVLDAIRDHSKSDAVGVASPLVQLLIGEVIKAVKG